MNLECGRQTEDLTVAIKYGDRNSLGKRNICLVFMRNNVKWTIEEKRRKMSLGNDCVECATVVTGRMYVVSCDNCVISDDVAGSDDMRF